MKNELLYVPTGCVVASKTNAGGNIVGVKWGAKCDMDLGASEFLNKLKATSKEWYKEDYGEPLDKVSCKAELATKQKHPLSTGAAPVLAAKA